MENSKKKVMRFTAIFVIMICLMYVSAFAAEENPIKSVSFSIKSTVTDGGSGDVEVKVRSSHYQYNSFEWVNAPDEWEIGDIPKVYVFLSAEDGYYFDKITGSGKVNVSGGTVVSVKTLDDKKTLRVTVKLKAVEGALEEPGDPHWELDDNSQFGKGRWEKSENAGGYEVRLYRDDKRVGGVETVTGTMVQFYPYFTKVGTYRFSVRAIPKSSQESYVDESDWIDSDEMDVDEDHLYDSSKVTDGGNYKHVGWSSNSKGWWYVKEDGSYPVNTWEFINGKWYLFDGSGYMLTGWQQKNNKWYYLIPPNGDMASNAWVGKYYVGADGAWIPSGWIQNQVGWWYVKDNGTYAANSWESINGRWYLFDANGYMMTGWQNRNGKWYYLNSPNGDMAANTWIDGYYLGNDGAWVQ